MKSAKARKQREFRYNAPLHIRQHFVHAHVSKELKEKLGLKARAIRVAAGDTVRIMCGKYKGKSGKVTKVDLKTSSIYLDSIKVKNARGKEHSVPLRSNNAYITDLNLSDKSRESRILHNGDLSGKKRQ
ncbi:MAG: 50S ribosomal protein L24 [Candidatus Micrarchaeaceae archaeon]